MLLAQKKDSLPNVLVYSTKQVNAAQSPVPVQRMAKEDISKLNAQSVGDAAKYFSGVIVKDYGGIGGLKTINVRSLGAAHTSLLYDGIPVSDVQAGQIDFGKYSLQNVESIELYNGQIPELLMPAKSFAYGSVINIKTTSQNQNKGNRFGGTAKLGSFGFVEASPVVHSILGKKLFASLSAAWQQSKGNYPYKAFTTTNEKSTRLNDAIRTAKAEVDLNHYFNDSNHVSLKLFGFTSKRELPGTVFSTLPNEELTDREFFIQSSWKRNIGRRDRVLLSGKFSNTYTYYIDPDFPNAAGRMENTYRQKEFFSSGALQHNFSKKFSTAFATDYIYSQLVRTDIFTYRFPQPKRYQWLTNIVLKYQLPNADFQVSLLNTHVSDRVVEGEKPGKSNVLSPTVAVSFAPSNFKNLRLRAFYKHIFRVPSFNDLYYTLIGNTSLKPEYATQYNAGITYQKFNGKLINTLLVTTDFYFNNVKDKILAAPRENIFQWTMKNIGLSQTKGIDLSIAASSHIKKIIEIKGRGNYSYQQSLDMDKGSPYYELQLPYTPMHTGAIMVSLGYKKVELSYNALFSSYRYPLGDQILDNRLSGWNIHNLNIGYNIFANKTDCKFSFELNNFLNKQYQVIRYYPMPGINYKIGITFLKL